MEREGAAMTCDGRLFHRRTAATGNALSPTVDRRVRRTSRDVDEAERGRGWGAAAHLHPKTKLLGQQVVHPAPTIFSVSYTVKSNLKPYRL